MWHRQGNEADAERTIYSVVLSQTTIRSILIRIKVKLKSSWGWYMEINENLPEVPVMLDEKFMRGISSLDWWGDWYCSSQKAEKNQSRFCYITWLIYSYETKGNSVVAESHIGRKLYRNTKSTDIYRRAIEYRRTKIFRRPCRMEVWPTTLFSTLSTDFEIYQGMTNANVCSGLLTDSQIERACACLILYPRLSEYCLWPLRAMRSLKELLAKSL